jgi:glycosyltransferase involved in cell wall biosynthesis
MQLRFFQILRSYRCYHYRDSSPSLKVELSPWYDHQIKGHPAKLKLKQTLETRLLRHLWGTFTMSRWGANGVINDYGLSPGRVHVALPGANLKKIHFVNRADRPHYAAVRILMVGGEFRRKGGEQLLEWAETTRKRGWELDIVTWPGDLPTWVKTCLGITDPNQRCTGSLTPRLPNVNVHCGLRANDPELLKLIEQADLFCLPTLADGSSLASLEAMAGGLPVVVGAVGGIPELIEHGQTGFLVRRGDVPDLGEKLEALIEDRSLRIHVGKNARRSCEEYFNVERQMRDIFTVIDRDAERGYPPH